MTSPVLVTGGTGRLGRSVVAGLVDAGLEVRVLARRQRDTRPQVTFFAADLRRGEGIEPAVRGAGVIIHCATSTKGDAEATGNLVTAAAKAGTPHFVQPSIVGIDAMSAWGYVKAKLEVERIVRDSGLPWTILRVTQFFNYCFENSRKLARFPSSRWQHRTAGPRTCRDRKCPAGRTCSAATWRPTVSADGFSLCRYPEARPCGGGLCSRRLVIPKGSGPGMSS
jgi:nucleoside-diphosphate-sugar epimerase